MGGSIVEPSTAAIDATNGNSIAQPLPEGWDRVILRIVNTFAGAKSVTLKAGDASFPIPLDYTVSMAQNEIRYIPVSPSARYAKADGSIALTYTAGMTGTVQVLVEPVGM